MAMTAMPLLVLVFLDKETLGVCAGVCVFFLLSSLLRNECGLECGRQEAEEEEGGGGKEEKNRFAMCRYHANAVANAGVCIFLRNSVSIMVCTHAARPTTMSHSHISRTQTPENSNVHTRASIGCHRRSFVRCHCTSTRSMEHGLNTHTQTACT